MKPPSALLEESAAPFDLACIQVRSLEAAAVRLMNGKDYHKLTREESDLLGIMTGMGLLETVGGFVRAKQSNVELTGKRKTMEEKNTRFKEDVFICQECGHEHDLGNYRLVKKVPTSPSPVQRLVRPLRQQDVIAAIRSVEAEAKRRGAMFPQCTDQHKTDRDAVQRVVEMIQWYGDNVGCQTLKGWPSA